MKSSSSRPKIGLALGSGGAKGLAHLGVIKTLEKHNIPIDYIAGSSIGAIIGAYYAKEPSYDALQELIAKITSRRLSSIIDISVKGGLIKGEKIERLLEETLAGATFESLKVPLATVATDFVNAETIVMKNGDLIRAIRASMSIPGFLRTIELDTRVLADGGLSNPVPVDVVREMGADITIAVNLDTLYVKQDMPTTLPLRHIPARSIDILRHHLALKSTRTADIIISPLVYSGMFAWGDFFSQEKIAQFIAEGERVTTDALPQILETLERYEKKHTFFDRIRKFFTPGVKQPYGTV